MKSSLSFARAGGLVAGLMVLATGCKSSSTSSPDGSTGTGGKGGAGGSGTDGAIGCTVAADLISDFASDNGLNLAAGLKGGWYTYADKSGFGTLLPPEGGGGIFMVADAGAGSDPNFGFDSTVGNPGCSGPGSWHVSAVNFTDWGAATGVDFADKTINDAGAIAKGTFDASKFRGISFWAKAASGTAIKFVQVSLLDPYTTIPSVLASSQACAYSTDPTDPAMTAKNCSPYLVKFGYGYMNTADGGTDATDLAADYPSYVSYKIDDTWKKFQILFADMKQDRNNPGQTSPGNKLDISQLTGMAIQVNSDHSTKPPTANNFELWIDDVTFVE